jgi:inorganic pyrophosphatase
MELTERPAHHRKGDDLPFPHRVPLHTHRGFPLLEVVIEVPRGSFLKRDASGRIEYVYPFPCPWNYGSVPAFLAEDEDCLDALVLGRRLSHGTRVRVQALGAVGFVDRGVPDVKLVCGIPPLGSRQRKLVLAFFRFYALCKAGMDRRRGRTACIRCEGWQDPLEAIGRCRPAGRAC